MVTMVMSKLLNSGQLLSSFVGLLRLLSVTTGVGWVGAGVKLQWLFCCTYGTFYKVTSWVVTFLVGYCSYILYDSRICVPRELSY